MEFGHTPSRRNSRSVPRRPGQDAFAQLVREGERLEGVVVEDPAQHGGDLAARQLLLRAEDRESVADRGPSDAIDAAPWPR